MNSISQSSNSPWAVPLRTHPLGCACMQCMPELMKPVEPPAGDKPADVARADAASSAGKAAAEADTGAASHAAPPTSYTSPVYGKPDGTAGLDNRAPPAGSHVDVRA
jgi:hypothetical protein